MAAAEPEELECSVATAVPTEDSEHSEMSQLLCRLFKEEVDLKEKLFERLKGFSGTFNVSFQGFVKLHLQSISQNSKCKTRSIFRSQKALFFEAFLRGPFIFTLAEKESTLILSKISLRVSKGVRKQKVFWDSR